MAGIDEVGRGPLAGPVLAAALILHRIPTQVSIDDSKRLTPAAREKAFRQIIPCASIGVGAIWEEEIDSIGIHAATHRAMLQALERLSTSPRWVLVDGRHSVPGCPFPMTPIVGGDGKSLVIACASIVAKVIRDRWMRRLGLLHPEYGFQRHKGYGTPEHLRVLRTVGPSLFHRYSFRPVLQSADDE